MKSLRIRVLRIGYLCPRTQWGGGGGLKAALILGDDQSHSRTNFIFALSYEHDYTIPFLGFPTII